MIILLEHFWIWGFGIKSSPFLEICLTLASSCELPSDCSNQAQEGHQLWFSWPAFLQVILSDPQRLTLRLCSNFCFNSSKKAPGSLYLRLVFWHCLYAYFWFCFVWSSSFLYQILGSTLKLLLPADRVLLFAIKLHDQFWPSRWLDQPSHFQICHQYLMTGQAWEPWIFYWTFWCILNT